MANEHETLKDLFTDIADSIRSKTGKEDLIVADKFPAAIAAISSNAGSADITIASNITGTTAVAIANIPYISDHIDDPELYLGLIPKTTTQTTNAVILTASCNSAYFYGGYFLTVFRGSYSNTVQNATGEDYKANSSTTGSYARVYADADGNVYALPVQSGSTYNQTVVNFVAGEYTLLYGVLSDSMASDVGLEELTVTNNGEYTPLGKGFSKVTVEVPMNPGYLPDTVEAGDKPILANWSKITCSSETESENPVTSVTLPKTGQYRLRFNPHFYNVASIDSSGFFYIYKNNTLLVSHEFSEFYTSGMMSFDIEGNAGDVIKVTGKAGSGTAYEIGVRLSVTIDSLILCINSN